MRERTGRSSATFSCGLGGIAGATIRSLEPSRIEAPSHLRLFGGTTARSRASIAESAVYMGVHPLRDHLFATLRLLPTRLPPNLRPRTGRSPTSADGRVCEVTNGRFAEAKLEKPALGIGQLRRSLTGGYGSAVTRRVEGEQSFDRTEPMFGVGRRMRAPRGRHGHQQRQQYPRSRRWRRGRLHGRATAMCARP